MQIIEDKVKRLNAEFKNIAARPEVELTPHKRELVSKILTLLNEILELIILFKRG